VFSLVLLLFIVMALVSFFIIEEDRRTSSVPRYLLVSLLALGFIGLWLASDSVVDYWKSAVFALVFTLFTPKWGMADRIVFLAFGWGFPWLLWGIMPFCVLGIAFGTALFYLAGLAERKSYPFTPFIVTGYGLAFLLAGLA
jgi:hypothetical protein